MTLFDERFEMNQLGCCSWDSTLSASGLTPDLVGLLATKEQVAKVCKHAAFRPLSRQRRQHSEDCFER